MDDGTAAVAGIARRSDRHRAGKIPFWQALAQAMKGTSGRPPRAVGPGELHLYAGALLQLQVLYADEPLGVRPKARAAARSTPCWAWPLMSPPKRL